MRVNLISSRVLLALTILGACSDPSAPKGPATLNRGPGAASLEQSAASPTSGTLHVTSNTTLEADHYGNILIEASGVTLDCAGHTVFGPGTAGPSGGINVDPVTNVTVKRCSVTGFNVNGIFAGGATASRYEANNVYGNGANGIHIDGGSNVLVGNTSSSNTGIGIALTRAAGSRIERNVTRNSVTWAGIGLLDGSHDVVVVGNTTTGNELGIVLDGANVDNRLIANIARANRGAGILLIRGADRNTLELNASSENRSGVDIILSANNNILRANFATRNALTGFNVYQSNNNTFTNNAATANGTFGFLVWSGSSSNTFNANIGYGNVNLDAYDERSGSPANVWTNNKFGTSSIP